MSSSIQWTYNWEPLEVLENNGRNRMSQWFWCTFGGGVWVPDNEVVSAERILVGLEASSVVSDDAGLLDVLHEPRVLVRLAHHVQVPVISCPDKYCYDFSFLIYGTFTLPDTGGDTETETDADTKTNTFQSDAYCPLALTGCVSIATRCQHWWGRGILTCTSFNRSPVMVTRCH